ncbi:RICIN domain-containing protein [Luteolibacter pohnpeiensis]|uniref:RICIN domain-containing protein n=1 Tax=Luteolibacter pohnpeiensis TaxID=454153 RepID=A0A934VSA7_9BACT|nr:RICIN domain-containing protein [Luteolibacter pohnpeiensis]MBK1884091.1 RICIN domain-containing protein [Luteolibacter pohnpeiensis]
MMRFANWTTDYLSTPDEARAALLPSGVSLAKERLDRLAIMISEDPKRALANAVPTQVRDELPTIITQQLETSIDQFGDLETEYHCQDEATSRWIATVDGTTYSAHVYGSRQNLNYYLGSSIHGIAIGNELAVLDGALNATNQTDGSHFLIGNEVTNLKTDTSVAQMASALAAIDGSDTNLQQALASKGLDATYGDYIYAMGDSDLSAASGYPKRRPVSHTCGGKDVLILRLQGSDGNFPVDETDEKFNTWVTSNTGWNARLKLTTYGKTWLNSVDVTPILTLPHPSSYYVYTSNGETVYESGRWADDGEAAARDAGYNPDDYYCVVVGTQNFDGGGIAWASGKRIWVNGAYDNFAALMNHEFGHVLGLPHASSWTCSDGNPISPDRVNVEYGDENDPMGNGGKTYRNTYQAYFKNLLQWMPDTSVQTITEDGIYTVWQDDGSTSFDRPLALKLGRDHEIMYWLSIRGDITLTDRIYDQSAFSSGVSVVAVTPWDNPHTLDLNNPNDGDRSNTPLALNQSFYDSEADITFKTVEVGGSNPNRYAKIQITFGPLHRGGYRPLVSGGVYRFRNRYNGRYLTVPNNSSSSGTKVQASSLNTGNNSQLWVAWRNSDGSYSFNHQGTDQWLDVQSDSGDDSATIWQYNYSSTGDNAQRWNIFQTEDDSVFLLHSGTEGRLMEMDVNTKVVHQMNMTGTEWQQWYPEMAGISPGTYRILPRAAETQALQTPPTLESGGIASRTKWLGYSNQQWQVSSLDNGRLRLSPTHALNKALDVSSGLSADGTRIQEWEWNESNAQRWLTSSVDGQWLRFTPDCAPLAAMQASGSNTDEAVSLWTYSGAENQQWRFADADPSISETAFQFWARAAGFSGDAALPESDPDGDGTINLMEFALAENPAVAETSEPFTLISTSEGPVLIAAFRTGATFSTSTTGNLSSVIDGITYLIQGSFDLVDWSLAPVEEVEALPAEFEGPTLSEGWSYRAFRIKEESPTGRAFLRIVVSE